MIISIASGKGGTGKTTLSTNLSCLLSENQNVTLVDLDVEEPNSGLFIKGKLIHSENKYKMIPNWEKEKCILCSNCQKVCKFNAISIIIDEVIVFKQLCHSCYACSELCPAQALPMKTFKMGILNQYQYNNLNFIESKLDIGQEQAVPLIQQTIEFVNNNSSKNSLVIYDAPPGTSCPVIEATKDADLVILVTEPTPFGLHDLQISVETMKELKKEFVIVINRYGIGNDKVDNYCKQEKIPVIARIPNNRKAAELYSKGKLLYKHIPGIKGELNKIAQFIQHRNKS